MSKSLSCELLGVAEMEFMVKGLLDRKKVWMEDSNFGLIIGNIDNKHGGNQKIFSEAK